MHYVMPQVFSRAETLQHAPLQDIGLDGNGMTRCSFGVVVRELTSIDGACFNAKVPLSHLCLLGCRCSPARRRLPLPNCMGSFC